jgi:predicted N-acetyltransferase YhbS
MSDWRVRSADDPDDFERVAAFFGEMEGAAEQAYCQRRLLHPRYRPELTRFIEGDGRILCAALFRHDRWLVDQLPLDVGFLGNIITHPDYRRRGLFTTLLMDSLQFLRGEGFHLAWLHGAVSLYAPFGFTPVRWHSQVHLPAETARNLRAAARPLGSETRQGAPGSEERGHPSSSRPRARPLAEADLPDVGALYAASYGGLPGSEERTAGVWRWLWPELMEHALAIEDAGGRLAAYAYLEPTHVRSRRRVVEAAAADGGAASALLAALADYVESSGPPTTDLPIYLALPLQHPVARAALLAGGEGRLVAPMSAGTRLAGYEEQACLLDPVGTLRALAPALETRLATSTYAGWQGAIAIEGEGVTLALEAGPEGISAGRLRGPVARVLRLPARFQAPLILGTYGARDLVDRAGVDIDEPLLGLLEALFPPLWPASESEDWWLLPEGIKS